MVLSSARSQATDGSGRQVATEGQGMSQDLGAGPGGKQGPCTAEQVVAPEGGQRAARCSAMALLSGWAEPQRGQRQRAGGRQLPFHHAVSLPPFLFVLALLACLQLALGLAALVLGGQGPCGNRKADSPAGLTK